jgi:hypothetical protein
MVTVLVHVIVTLMTLTLNGNEITVAGEVHVPTTSPPVFPAFIVSDASAIVPMSSLSNGIHVSYFTLIFIKLMVASMPLHCLDIIRGTQYQFNSGKPGDATQIFHNTLRDKDLRKAVTPKRSRDGVGGLPAVQRLWDPRYVDAPVVRFHDANTDGEYLDSGGNVLYYSASVR